MTISYQFLLIFLVSPVFAINMGSIPVTGFGDIYVVTDEGNVGNVEMHENGFTLNGGGGIHFAKEPRDDFSPEMFWATPLKDKHFSYTIDVSNVDCRCNSAGYFVSMHTNPYPGDWGRYYCDANFVNGVWCPEYDTWEGNKYTMSSALHTCNKDSNGDWDSCDRPGCASNAFYFDSNLMCPEDRCTINTNKPFTVSHSQNEYYVNVWFEQEGRTTSFNVCDYNAGYIGNMAAQSFNGMVFTASLWGGPDIDMSWLDGMTGCQGVCNLENQSVTFSNFAWF